MSFMHLLSISGAVRGKRLGSSPYRFLDSRKLWHPVLDDLPEVPVTELESVSDASGRNRPGAWGPAPQAMHFWLKVALLLGLLLLCTGVVEVSSLSQQKRVFALGQELRLQEARAEQYRWLTRWYRAQLAADHRLRQEEIEKYPAPSGPPPIPRSSPPPPEDVRPLPPGHAPRPHLPAIAVRTSPRAADMALGDTAGLTIPVSHRIRSR